MKQERIMLKNRQKFLHGLSLIELMITIAISVIPISLVGILLVGGQNSWRKTYHSAHREVEIQGYTATVTFERVGRKSQSDHCELYSIHGSSGSSERTPRSYTHPILTEADAVEFRYQLDKSSPDNVEYSYFYLDASTNKLMVEYSKYPRSLGQEPTRAVIVLADNVSKVKFSRTTVNNAAQGCVRMELTLKDPVNESPFTIIATTLMRN